MSHESSPLSALASIDAELADRLENDESFRRRYIRRFAQAEVAAEIRALRHKRGLTQTEVARLVNTGQSAIARIERADYDGWTYKTLISVADTLRARLRITFEPIEDVARGYRSSAHGVGSEPLRAEADCAALLEQLVEAQQHRAEAEADTARWVERCDAMRTAAEDARTALTGLLTESSDPNALTGEYDTATGRARRLLDAAYAVHAAPEKS